jgi:hypothetical protein
MEKFLCNCKGIEINLSIYTLQELTEEVPRVKRKECFKKSDHVTYFQNKSKWQHSMDLKRRLGMMSCIWHHR